MKKAVILLSVVLMSSSVMANTPPSAQATTPAQTHAKLDQILTDSEYSDSTEYKKWERLTPENPSTSKAPEWLDSLLSWLESLSGLLGVAGKAVAVLFLAWLLWWAYRTRETWLAWFERSAFFDHKKVAEVDTYTHIETPLWQGLPPKHQLVHAIKAQLAKHEWLSALSLLYQGTLREFGTWHHLPIAKHHTEEECVWLLGRAKHTHPKEMAYFNELVAMWRASAYGRRVPVGIEQGDYASIMRLLDAWQAIYGGGRE